MSHQLRAVCACRREVPPYVDELVNTASGVFRRAKTARGSTGRGCELLNPSMTAHRCWPGEYYIPEPCIAAIAIHPTKLLYRLPSRGAPGPDNTTIIKYKRVSENRRSSSLLTVAVVAMAEVRARRHHILPATRSPPSNWHLKPCSARRQERNGSVRVRARRAAAAKEPR